MNLLKVRKNSVVVMLIWVLLVFSFVLAGCKPTEETAQEATKEKATEAPAKVDAETEVEPTEELKPYNLKLYTIGTPQKDIPVVMEELSKYTTEKFNATIEMVQFGWGEYSDKMSAIILSGEKYDICFTCGWANNYLENVARGSFYPLNDLLEEYGQDVKAALPEIFFEGNKVDGELYCIPNQKEIAPQGRFLFNKEILDKYNLTVDSTKAYTYRDLIPMLETVQEGEKDNNIELYVRKQGDNPGPIGVRMHTIPGGDVPLGFNMVTDGVEIEVLPEMEEYMDVYTVMRDFYQKGFINKDAALSTDSEFKTTGKWFIRTGGWLPGADNYWSRGETATVVSVPMNHDLYGVDVQGSSFAISVGSDDPARAMMFLNLLNTDPYVRNMVDSGIEGVHYELKDGRQVDLDKAQDYNMPSFSLGNKYLLNIFENDPADLYDQYDAMNAKVKPSPLMGFVPNTEEYVDIIAAINNVVSEFRPALASGSVDPEEYLPQYIEKLKAAGIDELKDAMQKQADEFLANKK